MQIRVNIQAEVLDSEVARRKANVWLLENAGNLLRAEKPELILEDRLLWRYDVMLGIPKLDQPGTGDVYRVGQIVLDAVTGEVQNADTLAEELRVHAAQIQRLIRLGVTVTYGTGDERVLRDAIDRGLPPIVFLFSGDLPYWHMNLRHTVLVVGYSEDEVFINDPAFADSPETASWGDFLLAWSEFDYKYALISPAAETG